MTTRRRLHESAKEPGVKDILDRAQQYLELVINKDNAHYRMAALFGKRHRRLGIPVIITTTFVSTAIFTTLTEETAVGWRVATGIVSVAAAVLAALQTFFGFAEQSQQHLGSAIGYSSLRRRFEHFLLNFDSQGADRAQALSALDTLTQELDKLEATSPPIDEDVYNDVRERLLRQREAGTTD
jgi:hypothetical protein